MFSPQTYVARRKRLIDDVQTGIILLLGNEESPMNYTDNTFRFRQDSSFLYFFGLDAPHLAGVIDVDSGEEIVFGDDLTMDMIIWMGPQPPLAGKCEAVGVQRTLAYSALGAFLRKAQEQRRPLHFLPQYRGENVVRMQELCGMSLAQVAEGPSAELIRAVVAQRSIKSAEEVAEIERAVDICHEMHTTAMRMTRPGVVEQEVAGVLEGIALSHGGCISFPIIFSIHGETLHNHYHGNVMEKGDIAICDAGAETGMHYAGDITRTTPVGGRFDPRQRECYEIVLASQLQAIEAVRPGVEFRDVHRLAGEVLAEGLVGLGLMKGDVKEAVRAGAHTLFFQCGLGHQMGLDVHDMEGLGEDYVGYTDTIQRNPMFGFRSLRLGRALEPGFVITVEPGLYFIPALIDQWRAEKKLAQFINYDAVETFRDFGGIRLEDDLLVTEDGYRVLGPPIPRTVEEVEALASA